MKRVVMKTVFVQREGKQVQPPIGKEFDFTAEELADLKRMNPRAIRTKNEGLDEDTVLQDEAEATAKANAEAEAKKRADAKAADDKRAAEAKEKAAKKEADAKAAAEKRAADAKAGKTSADEL